MSGVLVVCVRKALFCCPAGRMFRFGLQLLCLVVLFASPAMASDGFRLSGFGSIGYSHDDADGVGFMRNQTQPVPASRDASFRSDSILGVQASYRFDPTLDATAQVVLRDRADPSFDESIEWAYLAWRPRDDLDVRLGRTGVDVFLLSDYRNLGYAQPWVRPPREFYGWIPFFSIDGADIAWRFTSGDTRWQIKAQAGRSSTPFPHDEGKNFDFRVDRFRDITVLAERGAWQFKAGYAAFTVGSEPDLTPLSGPLSGLAASGFGLISAEAGAYAAGLHLDGARVRYKSLGAAYDDGTWLMQGEVARIDSESRLMATGTSSYLSVGRRFGRLTPYASIARFDPERDGVVAGADWSVLGPAAQVLQARSIAAYNAFRIDQTTLTLGVRWDFDARAALKLQWDRSHVEGQGYGLWQIDNVTGGDDDRRIDVWSITMDFIF